MRWLLLPLLLLTGVGIVAVKFDGVSTTRQLAGWIVFDVRRKLSPEQDAAGPTYNDTANGPVSLATLVRQLRVAWPGESMAVVHGAAQEIATGLLHHDDVEVGVVEGGKFVPWPISRWAAEEKIRTELISMHEFLADEGRYVFRRKRVVDQAGMAPASPTSPATRERTPP